MKKGETKDELADAISEYGARAVAAGLHRLGREPTKAELDAVNGHHDEQCASRKGHPCNCPLAILHAKS